MFNFFVDYRGGASTRPGTQLIDRTRYSATKARLLSFIFSQSQTYIIELGDLYMRFYSNGAQLVEAAKPITGVSLSNPCQLTIVGHGYAAGKDIFVQGSSGRLSLIIRPSSSA
jgi:hypothetical protein